MTESLSTKSPSTYSYLSDGVVSPYSAIAQFFAAISTEENGIDINQLSLKMFSFRLGDEILDYKLVSSVSVENAVHSEQYEPDFYLICQGRVRLLCRSTLAQAGSSREVTTLLLEANETFGADRLLLDTSLPYRAVAASPVQVARIPVAALGSLLEQHPQLHEALLAQAQQRERLIFLRTCPSLRSLSSQQLLQLLPYLIEETIPPGTSLKQLGQTGRFWLRAGVVQGQDDINAGDSWGYPNESPTDWIAQTPLQVYKLPLEDWETVISLLPALKHELPQQPAPSAALVADSPVADVPPRRPVAPKRPQSRTLYPIIPNYQDQPSDSQQDKQKNTSGEVIALKKYASSNKISFPKPARRRFLDWIDRYPWIEQQSSSDCGAACLAMISKYWGKYFPIYILREQCNINRSGASLKSLAKAAENLGFHARPVRASFNRMAEQPHPWIAHWEGNHYIVVYKVRSKRVIIADPALGRRSLSTEEFQKYWTGYALLLTPTERLKATETKQASLQRYIGALLPYRSIALQVIALSVLLQVFGLITPLFTQLILDRVLTQKSLTMLTTFVIGLLLFGIWGLCLGAVRQYLLIYFSNHLDMTLIGGFIGHALSLPLKFFESRRVGDIITRIQENRKIQRFLIQQVVLAWLSFVTGFVYLGLMLYYNWKLTLMVLLIVPPIVIVTLSSTPFLRQISREIFKEAADQNSLLVEMFTGIATVKSTATDKEIRWRWEDQLTRLINTSFRGRKFAIGLGVVNGSINSIGSTLLLWYGASLVIHDELTIGQFVAFNMMIGFVISPILGLANLWDQLQEILISVERLNDVFEAEPEETAEQALLAMPPIQGAVVFDDVTFRYGEDEEKNTLQNLSFQVEPGQTIAIVGRSGSGKTTLAKLLQGLYHPNRGLIKIDGHDIRHVSLHSLRSQLGVVPQECFLFSGTILENITLFRPEFSLEQAVEVAKLAEAHTFIQTLPLGYNTKVGERGSSLSGGQRQRVAIARALLGDPRILILDEATSSLDTESERRFQNNLAQLRRNRTTFIIAHRLSTVRNADNILVLDRGILAEQGSHEELMKAEGLYYHLAHQQLDL